MRKICGQLAFDKKELELVASVGDQTRDQTIPNDEDDNSHGFGYRLETQ